MFYACQRCGKTNRTSLPKIIRLCPCSTSVTVRTNITSKVDDCGSEFACGGRKERSVDDALLIVKLIQDYAKWTKKKVVIKFLDVEKFFDSMNYKLALIEAFRSGVDGRHWQTYKTINSSKTCIPHIASGQCSPIEVRNVFVQGSCDAVLVAWPLMDADSKRTHDCFSADFCVEGIAINRMSFVDDLIEFDPSIADANVTSVSSEVLEKKTRLKFKVPKCKVMPMNCKIGRGVILNDQMLDEVKEHVYLGTIISANGERFAEMNSRLLKANSVSNEIEQICKMCEMSNIRLKYVRLLMGSCLDFKIKFGCAVWNVTKFKSTSEKLDKIKPTLLKRVLQVPLSTPSTAIQFDFGVNDLTLEVLMEKIILAVKTLNLGEQRISKQILKVMFEKQVPGFCTELSEACDILGVSLQELLEVKDVRKFLKKKVISIQSGELLKRMLLSSKMDRTILSEYVYNGKMMTYLSVLNFNEARAVFMSRYRMWPTKRNFPGRWNDVNCNICSMEDTDEHIFVCPGYSDLIIEENVTYDMFWDKDVLQDVNKLKVIASVAITIIERLELIQKIK